MKRWGRHKRDNVVLGKRDVNMGGEERFRYVRLRLCLHDSPLDVLEAEAFMSDGDLAWLFKRAVDEYAERRSKSVHVRAAVKIRADYRDRIKKLNDRERKK